jgi:hypothetical protein
MSIPLLGTDPEHNGAVPGHLILLPYDSTSARAHFRCFRSSAGSNGKCELNGPPKTDCK